MRRKVKKSLAVLLATLLVLSTVLGGALSVFAEDTGTTEQTWFETEEIPTEPAASSEEAWDDQAGGPGETDNAIPQETGTFWETDSENFYETEKFGANAETDSVDGNSEEGESVSEEMVEYQPENQPYGVVVKAQAAKGVLPEGAFMTVEELSEGSEQHKAAEEALEASDVEFDGFKALDISFIDAWGNKIEPEDGAVQVSIELDTSLLPEEVSQDTLAIQHLDEANEQLEVQTVADAANGTVAVEGGTVKADFTVESFSTFTITWGSIITRNVTVKYVNQNGTEITATQASNVKFSHGETVELSTYAYDIDGYTYQGARIGSINGTEVKSLKTTEDGKKWTYKLQYQTPENDNRWHNLTEETILLVYEGADPAIPPVVTTGQQMRHDKYVELKNDGTYDLTLTVSGAVGTSTTRQQLDVVYVLDKSGSMDKNMSNDNGSKGERRKAAGDAITTLTNALSSNENLDVRFSLVTFQKTASRNQDWTSSAQRIINAAYPDSDGGTNYQAGIREAKNLLKTKREDAMTVVIFVSDGNPTYRFGVGDKIEGNGSSDNNGFNLDAAKKEVETLSANFFFTVGVGPSGNYQKLRDLKDAAVNAQTRAFYEGTDAASLKAAFDDIQGQITMLLCSDVTITDALSDNVQLVKDASGNFKELTVKVTDKDGNVVAQGPRSVTLDEGVTITAVYNPESKTITLDFPDDYRLEAGYTYSVTANIDATEEAYEAYRANGNQYPDTGGIGTGVTSEEKQGVYTNRGAKVTYIYQDSTYEAEYAKPVIQLHPGTLTIEKTITGLDEDDITALEGQITFECSLNGNTAEQIPLSIFTKTNDGKYVYSIKGLSPNTAYTITEKNADIDGYDLTTHSNGNQDTIGKDDKKTAIFTNSYTPSNRNLTISKTVSGNMGDTEKAFDFTMKILKKDGTSYTEDLKVGESTYEVNADGKYEFSLKHGENIVFNLPYECQYTVSEAKGDYTAYVAIGEGEAEKNNSATGTLSADTTLNFRNEKEVITPTGVYKTVLPYIMMVVVAIEAIICCVVLYLKKRIR